MKLITPLFFILFLLAGCGGDESNDPVVLPSDLELQVDISEDIPGKVEVTATADNTNYYNVYFGLGAGESPQKTTQGTATHTYSESGTYTIKVQAHATDKHFITATEEITVTLSDPNEIPIPTEGYSTPSSYSGMTLVWQDEFESTTLNNSYWTFETGGHGWGNNELQYYRSENTSFQDGHLIITAKKEDFSGSNYTSSRIKTQGKKSFQYGRIDIRAALPEGQGIWPALWMLGANIATVPWPACGEIDIMEMIGGSGRENTVFGTLHWDSNGHVCTCDKPGKTLSSGTYHDKFHVFTITWDESFITWYVDDVQFNKIDITPAALSEFKSQYFLIFNVAVGGNWPGSPNSSTVFPQHMIVDYVRVFQNN